MADKTLDELCYVDEFGFHLADYEDFFNYIAGNFQAVYGSDINLDADAQDGQLVAHIAQAMYNLGLVSLAVYNSYSPTTAVGDALSRQVKINGIARLEATKSTVDLTITGTGGTVITDGQVRDQDGNVWELPETVTIPLSGSVTVTATAKEEGEIKIGMGKCTVIATPTEGWISVTNASESVAGRDVETDYALRIRQTKSTSRPSQSILKGILGDILNISGVTRAIVYENDTSVTDSHGIPSHSLCAVVEGGDAAEIAEAIRLRKTVGTGTYGTTSVTLTDSMLVPITIHFFRPTIIHLEARIEIEALSGYLSLYEDSIREQVTNYINNLSFGETVRISKLYVPANLENDDSDKTYDILSIQIAKKGGTLQSRNIEIPFNSLAEIDEDDIDIVIPS